MKLNKQRLLETIQVKSLSKEETVELIKRTFGEQTVSPEFADLICQHTGGNPFFVEEVLRSLVEDGTIFRTETKWDRKPIQESNSRSQFKKFKKLLEPTQLRYLLIDDDTPSRNGSTNHSSHIRGRVCTIRQGGDEERYHGDL